ncbi:hypothetical protein ACOMHN_054567 [Nucella lapillus]
MWTREKLTSSFSESPVSDYLTGMSTSATPATVTEKNVRGTGIGVGAITNTEDRAEARRRSCAEEGEGEEGRVEDARPLGVDIHAVLGLPRPKRPSERSDQAEEQTEGSDTDDLIDSDDDTEELQEGEYLVIDDPEDEERTELQVEMLAEVACRARDSLVPIFIACCAGYDKWMKANSTAVSATELSERRKQLQLYRKVLELYGNDVEWEGLTHAQQVNRNKMAHDTSLEAKLLGPPPSVVTDASVTDQHS